MPLSQSDSAANSTINYAVGSINLITGEVEYTNLGYNITRSTAIVFLVLFAISTIAHLGQGIASRRWFLLGTLVLGGVSECIGWSARLASALSVKWVPTQGGFWDSNGTAFLAQISTLIFAPAFLQAGNYIILGLIIGRLGYRYCRLEPRTYIITFIFGDVVSLVVQAIGGGLASAAETNAQANKGAYIVVGGVIAQLIVMIAFSAILVDFSLHYLHDRPVTRQWRPFAWCSACFSSLRPSSSRSSSNDNSLFELDKRTAATVTTTASLKVIRGVKLLLLGISGSTLLICIRSIYRTIELLDGWSGPIITNQLLFNVLDGMPILCSMVLLNVFHPVFFLKKLPETTVSGGDQQQIALIDSTAMRPQSEVK